MIEVCRSCFAIQGQVITQFQNIKHTHILLNVATLDLSQIFIAENYKHVIFGQYDNVILLLNKIHTQNALAPWKLKINSYNVLSQRESISATIKTSAEPNEIYTKFLVLQTTIKSSVEQLMVFQYMWKNPGHQEVISKVQIMIKFNWQWHYYTHMCISK